MRTSIPFERPGFRTWPELLRDLEAIAATPPPLNNATLSFVDPGKGGRALTGQLGVQHQGDAIDVTLDGVRATRWTRQAFRGAWRSASADLPGELTYVINIDVGRGHAGPQLRGDVLPSSAAEPDTRASYPRIARPAGLTNSIDPSDATT